MKKALSVLLIVAMVLTSSDVTVFASEGARVDEGSYSTVEGSEEIGESDVSEETEPAEETTGENGEGSNPEVSGEEQEETGDTSESDNQNEEAAPKDETLVVETDSEIVSEEENSENGEETELVESGSCGENLTWELRRDGTLTISGTGPMFDYEKGSFYPPSTAPWAGYNGAINKIVLEEGITTIGNYAFFVCLINPTCELKIPDSVTTIGAHAFDTCNFTGDLIIPENVTTIGAHAFEECNFAGELKIPDSVRTIGEYAFAYCKGFTGDLEIPDSVTTIEEYTFYSCRDFTGKLKIPDSVTMIGDRAFSSCSGLTGDLNIPDSVTTIGEAAFHYCSGLTGILIIPDGVTEILSWTFYGCDSLDGIAYIPSSVVRIENKGGGAETLKPITTIYGKSGSCAETYAKKYGKTFIPYDPKSSKDTVETNKDSNTINIYVKGGNKIKLPVSGALVNGKETNSIGYVSLPVTEDGKMQFTISADGYETLKTQKKVTAGGTYYFSMTSDCDIIADINNDITSLLNDKLYLQSIDENIETSSEKVDMAIKVLDKKDIVKYELFLATEKLSENTNGIFTIPIIKKDGKLYANLQADKKLVVRVTYTGGKKSQYTLGVCIDKVDIDTENMPTDISIMPNVNSDAMGDDVPYFGGMDASFGFKNGAKVSVEIEEDGRIKIAIGMEAEGDFETHKKRYIKLVENKAKGASQNSYTGFDIPFDAGKVSGGVSVCGYGEGFFDKRSKRLEIEVGVVVSGKVSGSYTQPFVLWIIPFYVSVEAGLEISAGSDFVVIYENKDFNFGGGVTLEGKIYLTPKIAVGLEDVASLGVSGTGAANLKWQRTFNSGDYWKIWLDGNLTVFAQASSYELTLFKSPTASWTIYETGQSTANAMYSQALDSDSYTLMSRNYLTEGGINTVSEVSGSAVKNAVYEKAVYPGASPQLVCAGNKLYLFWLQDIESRSPENRAALVFATSTDGNNWSEPVQLVAEEDNQTLDDDFDVYVDNDKIYVCWQDAAEEFASGISLNEMIQKLNISYAVVNAATGSVEKTETVTKEVGSYLQPKIAAKDGKVYITYISNHMTTEGGIWDADNTEELIRYDSESNALTTLSIGNGREKIAGMDMVATASGAGIYYTVDKDGDFTTIGDRALVYDNRDGSSGSQTALTGEGRVYSPSVAGENCYWYADGNLYCASAGAASTPLYETTVEGVPEIFKAVSDGSNTILLWSSIDADTEKVSLYGIKQSGDGSWSAPFVIERTDSEMTGETTGAYMGGSLLVSYPDIRFQEDDSKIWTLCVTKEEERKDISLDGAGYDVDDFKLGEKLPIAVTLSNKGNTAVELVDVSWDGTSLGSQEIHLGAGETGTFVLENYTVPANLTGYAQHTLTVSVAGEMETDDNSASVGIGYTDLEVIASQRLQDGNTWLDISALNQSDIATNATLNIRAKAEDGEILYSDDLGEISGNSGMAVSLSLEDYEDSNVVYYVEAVSDVEDVFEGNNVALVYTGFGVDIEEGGGDDPLPVDSYSVTFLSNGGSEVEGQLVEDGKKVSKPSDPTKEGYRFVGWYLDGEPYDFNSPVRGNITLEAHWEEDNGGNTDPSKSFTVTFNSNGGSVVESQRVELGKMLIEPQIPTREGYRFAGWYLDDEPYDFNTPVTRDITLVALWETDGEGGNEGEAKEGLWFSVIPDQTYTGSAIKPVVKVYYEKTLLKEKTDYTITYKNNKNANDASAVAAAPTVIVKGKSNYTGKETMTFKILPRNLADEAIDVNFTDSYVYKAGSQPKISLTVKYGKQTLKKDKDYKLSYKNSSGAAVTDISAEGSYTLVMTGAGNYTGTQELAFEVLSKTPVSKLKVSKIASLSYDGSPKEPSVTVKDGKTTLEKDVDYELSYANNTEAGQAAVTITGKGNYSGSRKVFFTITGMQLSKVKIQGFNSSVEYTGDAVVQNIQLTAAVKTNGTTTDKTLKEGTDYQIKYENNTDSGKATVTLTGKGGYTGTVKKTFTIKPYDIKSNSASKFTVSSEAITAPYAKGGATPDVEISFGGKKLELVKDYTLSYSNNKAVTTSSTTKQPSITITGKGNFKGKLTGEKSFTITKQNLSTVKASADDVVYKDKAGNYKSVPVLYDLDGKKMSAGSDYSKTYKYSYVSGVTLADGTIRSAGDEVGANDIVPVGTEISVTVTASESAGCNYQGETNVTYHVVPKSLKGAKVKVLTNFEYTGNEVCLTKEDLQVTPKGESQATGSYEILTDTYNNNTKKGTASVQIRGTGDYGGIVTVKYKIKAKTFKWWIAKLFS